MSSTDSNSSTEIDEALKIARTTREKILFGNSSLTKDLLSFFTVAQILGRKDDLTWAENELEGYPADKKIPAYRQECYCNFTIEGTFAIKKDILQNDHFVDLGIDVPGLLHFLNEKEDFISMSIGKETLKELNSKHNCKLEEQNVSIKVPQASLATLVGFIQKELVKRLNSMISEITYGKIPQEIFKEFKDKVDGKLAISNPGAIRSLNVAYESLGASENPEKTAQVALACRRLIKHVADGLFSPKNEKHVLADGVQIDVTDDKVLNRLIAYIDSKQPKTINYLIKEIELLRDLLHGEGSANQGIHENISNNEARQLVLQTYVILGDIILSDSE